MMTNMDKLYEAVEARGRYVWVWIRISATCLRILWTPP